MERLFTVRRRNKDRRGQSIIEFALILPILLLVVFGITEFGRAFWTMNVLTQAAREGVRVAAVGGTQAAVLTRVDEVLSAAGVTRTAFTYTAPNPTDPDQKVTVTVTSDFQVLSKSILPMTGTIPLTGSSVMRFEG